VTDIHKALVVFEQLEQAQRDRARADAEQLEQTKPQPSPEEQLVDRLQAWQSNWTTIDLGRPE
jgi:hypothetical protein